MNCKDCKYCHHLVTKQLYDFRNADNPADIRTHEEHQYHCYRFPPQPEAYGGQYETRSSWGFPAVRPDEYCAEYEAGEFFNIKPMKKSQAEIDKRYKKRYQDIERTEFEVERVMDTRIDCMCAQLKAA